MTLPRSKWIAALTTLPEERIIELAKHLATDLDPQPVSLPSSGLQLLAMRDGVKCEPYYLGEIPMVTAHISLLGNNGQRVEAGASLMSDSMEHVMALAILDGVMAHHLPGVDRVKTLIQEGTGNLEHIDAERGQVLSRTKVDFTLV